MFEDVVFGCCWEVLDKDLHQMGVGSNQQPLQYHTPDSHFQVWYIVPGSTYKYPVASITQ